MIKALLKKQLLETFAGFVRKGKNGKKRSKAAGIGFGLLYIYVFGVFISMFYMLADTLYDRSADGRSGQCVYHLFHPVSGEG